MSSFQTLDECFLKKEEGLQTKPSSFLKASEGLREGMPLAEPQVELLKEAGKLKTIHVHCTCGQTISLNCEYPSPHS